jgi:hypothetical protein
LPRIKLGGGGKAFFGAVMAIAELCLEPRTAHPKTCQLSLETGRLAIKVLKTERLELRDVLLWRKKSKVCR